MDTNTNHEQNGVDIHMTTKQSPLWKTIALYIVKIIHVACSILCLVGPYLTNNVLYLSLLVLYCSGVYFSWYTLGFCLFTGLEEYLGEQPASYNDGTKKSFIASFMNKYGINEYFISSAFITVPAITIIVCVYKINMLYYGSVKNTLPISNLPETLNLEPTI